MPRMAVMLSLVAVVAAASAVSAGWHDNLVDDPIDFGAFMSSPTEDPVDGPNFKNSYHAKGVIRIPYAEIEEPFEAWYDLSNPNNTRSRVDYYDGVMQTFQLQHPDKGYAFGAMRKIVWQTVGSIDTPVRGCFEVNGTKENPTAAQTVVPDVQYFVKVESNVTIAGQQCELWRNVTVLYNRTNTYNLWLARRDSHKRTYYPVRYEMKGFNSLLGSHFDHYIIDYAKFDFGSPGDDVFDVPAGLTCTGFPGPGRTDRASFNPIGEMLSEMDHRFRDEFEDFKRTHSKNYDSNVEHERRLVHFRHNMRFIESFNRKNVGFTLASNHMTDYTPDEFKILRGRKPTKGYNGGMAFEYVKEDLKDLPGFWDWRYIGAVTPVKDQSICGSCWTFGTTGTLEGAYFLKTGKLVKLSQQALIDCSWRFDNNGCDGGEDFRAYEWMMKEGGIPTADSYGPYMGIDGKCHVGDAGVEKVGKLFGYVNVTSGDQEALKLALFRQGPISVAIDASQRTFSFYSNGVYFDPKCSNTELDHAVLAVGYGELYGQPYWLVKNSWSTYWGNDGYILMSMKENNCGVATEATFVIM